MQDKIILNLDEYYTNCGKMTKVQGDTNYGVYINDYYVYVTFTIANRSWTDKTPVTFGTITNTNYIPTRGVTQPSSRWSIFVGVYENGKVAVIPAQTVTSAVYGTVCYPRRDLLL